MCSGIVLDGSGGIVWQNGPNGDANGSIRRLAPSGNAPTPLAASLDLVSVPAVGGGRVLWSTPSGFGTAATLASAPLAGGNVTTVLTLGTGNGSASVPVAADAAAVYFSAAPGGLNDGTIQKASLDGKSAVPIAASLPVVPGLVVRNQVMALLVDDHDVYAFDYWADGAGMHGRIRSVAK